MNRVLARSLWALALSPCLAASAAAQAREVYRCPGNPVLYTDTLSAKEARDKGCRTLEGAPITVVQGVRPRPTSGPVPATTASRPADQRVNPGEQRARDSDARRILEGELRREEERLAEMQREFNNGEPERHGVEAKNPQRYLDRVAEMRAGIQRKEGDIAAIKRELSKLPPQ
jgi:hypothetical protein